MPDLVEDGLDRSRPLAATSKRDYAVTAHVVTAPLNRPIIQIGSYKW
jgi:hypothetical protein